MIQVQHTIVSHLIELLVSLIIGAILTGVSALAVERKRRNTETERLRRALSVEIQGSEERVKRLVKRVKSDKMSAPTSTAGLPTEVYQQSLSGIGKLSAPEIESVLNFYQNLSELKELMEERRDTYEGKKDLSEQSVRESDMALFLDFTIELRVEKLRRQQIAALFLLSNKSYRQRSTSNGLFSLP